MSLSLDQSERLSPIQKIQQVVEVYICWRLWIKVAAASPQIERAKGNFRIKNIRHKLMVWRGEIIRQTHPGGETKTTDDYRWHIFPKRERERESKTKNRVTSRWGH